MLVYDIMLFDGVSMTQASSRHYETSPSVTGRKTSSKLTHRQWSESIPVVPMLWESLAPLRQETPRSRHALKKCSNTSKSHASAHTTRYLEAGMHSKNAAILRSLTHLHTQHANIFTQTPNLRERYIDHQWRRGDAGQTQVHKDPTNFELITLRCVSCRHTSDMSCS
jgi:hypothetical protein